MESVNFHNIKMEKANAILRYKKRQRMTTLFRFIEFCIFFVIISRFSTQLPLSFMLSIDYFKGFGVTLITPRFVFVLVNAIVIILFFKSGHSSAKDASTDNVKFDLYDEYKQKYSMNKEAYSEQSKKQRKQSILVEEANCEQNRKQRKQSTLVVEANCEQSKKQGKQRILVEEANCEQNRKQRKQSTLVIEANCEQSKKQGKQSILVEELHCEQSKKQRKQSIMTESRLEKRIHRSHSENALNSSHNEKKPRKRMIRSATVGCLKVIDTDCVKPATTTMTTTSFPEDRMSNDEFRKTVEAFIARQQRLLREEEFSIST